MVALSTILFSPPAARPLLSPAASQALAVAYSFLLEPSFRHRSREPKDEAVVLAPGRPRCRDERGGCSDLPPRRLLPLLVAALPAYYSTTKPPSPRRPPSLFLFPSGALGRWSTITIHRVRGGDRQAAQEMGGDCHWMVVQLEYASEVTI